jgi:hypothetical protein
MYLARNTDAATGIQAPLLEQLATFNVLIRQRLPVITTCHAGTDLRHLY